jgi:hypothetical protein
MLVVKVELHSAITGQVSEIARMDIWNNGKGSANCGCYDFKAHPHTLWPSGKELPEVRGRIAYYSRVNRDIWRLVAHAAEDAVNPQYDQ